MAITIRNVVQAFQTAGTTATTPSLGNVGAGDLIVICINGGVLDNTATFSDNSGLGTSYNEIQSRYDGNGGAGMWYAFMSGSATGLTVSCTATSGINRISVIVWWVTGVNAYNGDEANNADFSGTSAAWTVGPTSPPAPAGSIFFYINGTELDQTGTAEVSGFNVTGSNGFTSTMNTNSKIVGGNTNNTLTGYLVTNGTQSASTSNATAGDWFGVLASFAASGSTQVTEDYWLVPAVALPDLSTWVFS
jgi:hypothetical protein